VPETLFESEFFGHARGAFTGAQQIHRGLFEQAHGGTLFLDEIGELPLAVQAKLLTALEDREFRRVGGEQAVRVDCRVIAATGVDLPRAINARRFRRDLYHRLLVLAFDLPPLRERGADIDVLAQRCLSSCARRYDRFVRGFTPAALAMLRAHPWPGNVRQLSHAVEAAVLAARSPQLDCADFPASALDADASGPDDERMRLLDALRRARGNRSRAASSLGIARNTLRARMRRWAITDADVDAD
jgi:DNA-binding NtrC family response regulator